MFLFLASLLQSRKFLRAGKDLLNNPSRYRANLTSILDHFHLRVAKL